MGCPRIGAIEKQTTFAIVGSFTVLIDQIVLAFLAVAVVPIMGDRAHIPVPGISFHTAALRFIRTMISEEGIKPFALIEQDIP